MPTYLVELYHWATYIFSIQIADGGILGTLGGWIPIVIVLYFATKVMDDLLY